jgi:hypothetical protein
MLGKSSSHEDWKSIGGFANDFMGRAWWQPALSICLCGFPPGHKPADKRDRCWIVWHDLICRRGGLLPAFFVVSHCRKHRANRRHSHQHDVSCHNHVCRGRLARQSHQHRAERESQRECRGWSTSWALNIPACHQAKVRLRVSYSKPVNQRPAGGQFRTRPQVERRSHIRRDRTFSRSGTGCSCRQHRRIH